jgi:hypothetical protein
MDENVRESEPQRVVSNDRDQNKRRAREMRGILESGLTKVESGGKQ